MNKSCILLSCFLCFVISASAQKKISLKTDPKDAAGYHKLNFSFTWFELGASVALKEKKLQNLPYGMNHYLYGSKGGFAGGIWGVGVYYKDRWGVAALLSFQDYSVPDAAYKKYISSQYPGYIVPYGVQGHTYTLDAINYRISYRFHKGPFVIEPQFQFGINDCNDFDTRFVLKEEGTNNFIEYNIERKNNRKNLFSYRAALAFRWCIARANWNWNIEPSLRYDFIIIPTNFNYTVTSAPYNMPPTVYELNVRRMRPAMTITAGLNIFRK